MNNLGSIKNIISEQFGVSDNIIEPDAKLASDLNLTQLEIIDILTILSRKLKFALPDNIDIESIKSVSDIQNLIEENSEDL
ncbi:hypothetical protein COV53_03390 [Candidatus Gottesmanbacteria bacterium CG11_big_fil_rev_8_21_14_0_20_37_11]|uniref:Carrier domain-containing protein n=3 Tax=Candidatus Gottesmaniibacteriota TaxID=1752720 RepID=A0A2M7RPY6_9BACT|nr:MAG: hypothetical protein AUJ73_05295 [Candidatus Gottesmanbacteria bacterium CG1_02_37_22]PIP32256.1 MAG: hypothetical protein COX23_05640 [Candidatus Gottesmanbacteria bacterium CG23_combo_of_CG06-09_8_20_14_all_37_19]PIR08364.1 MAG: hypothetical protein COV53_03390 [Candidatus Gottesmanbacteria bacterium CG11_big_fil_rev_8_21_14_0_20_37_11]PIZ02322.1 MAG: hypothetical protein COY59_05335 [Candidatus Gottesmanbacteria bacterium CG_4_10_14_0_8_um_filter_37_24]